MIPRETKCRYCGMPVMFVSGPRGLLCVEARLRPYRFNRAGEEKSITTFYTNTGTPLPVIELSDDTEEDIRGYAHRFHFCPKKRAGKNPTATRENPSGTSRHLP